MKKLSLKQKQTVVTLHIFFSVGWLGTGLCLVLLVGTVGWWPEQDAYTKLVATKLIDDFVLIPAATGVVITGTILSWMTNWGFTKYYWVLTKWIVTLALVIFGTFWLGPWLNDMIAATKLDANAALQQAPFLSNQAWIFTTGLLQNVLLTFLIVLSIFKPWGKRKTVK